ncbi:hypothetical protein CERSUDRAFT_84266 [Gelatoporia subvermispora B]|uniref:Uncharacterized protein n=1 Tax=Ceriporiopsis subvermispora (strain B) TaxID=914234 RepID=M2RCP7_CERS8|nr:hypothetical protein CERSUDRAFT_84266 [Gelatoporia subvermispora B]
MAKIIIKTPDTSEASPEPGGSPIQGSMETVLPSIPELTEHPAENNSDSDGLAGRIPAALKGKGRMGSVMKAKQPEKPISSLEESQETLSRPIQVKLDEEIAQHLHEQLNGPMNDLDLSGNWKAYQPKESRVPQSIASIVHAIPLGLPRTEFLGHPLNFPETVS